MSIPARMLTSFIIRRWALPLRPMRKARNAKMQGPFDGNAPGDCPANFRLACLDIDVGTYM